jgi:hypothetical protein
LPFLDFWYGGKKGFSRDDYPLDPWSKVPVPWSKPPDPPKPEIDDPWPNPEINDPFWLKSEPSVIGTLGIFDQPGLFVLASKNSDPNFPLLELKWTLKLKFWLVAVPLVHKANRNDYFVLARSSELVVEHTLTRFKNHATASDFDGFDCPPPSLQVTPFADALQVKQPLPTISHPPLANEEPPVWLRKLGFLP